MAIDPDQLLDEHTQGQIVLECFTAICESSEDGDSTDAIHRAIERAVAHVATTARIAELKQENGELAMMLKMIIAYPSSRDERLKQAADYLREHGHLNPLRALPHPKSAETSTPAVAQVIMPGARIEWLGGVVVVTQVGPFQHSRGYGDVDLRCYVESTIVPLPVTSIFNTPFGVCEIVQKPGALKHH